MAAANHNFSIEAGSDFQITFQYLDENQNPIDLRDYCVSLLWRPLSGAGFPQGFSSSQPTSLNNEGFTLIKSTNGNIIFSLSYNFTKKITWTQAVYDLYISDGALTPRKYKLSTGTIDLIPNNFPECATQTTDHCTDCNSLIFDSVGPVQPVPTPTGSIPVSTPSLMDSDICAMVCDDLDMYAEVYKGGEFFIFDNSEVSDTISIANTGIIQNIEIVINKLKHQHPQDLAMILVPPTGDKILLSAHNKILHNNVVNGFSFVFSNKASSGTYINNVTNNSFQVPYVNILDKTSIYNYNNENLSSNLQSWIGSVPSGDWSLITKDDDIGTSGTLQDWSIIITYVPPALTIEPDRFDGCDIDS